MHPFAYIAGCKCRGDSMGHTSFIIYLLYFSTIQQETLLAEAFLNALKTDIQDGFIGTSFQIPWYLTRT